MRTLLRSLFKLIFSAWRMGVPAAILLLAVSVAGVAYLGSALAQLLASR